MSIPLELWWMAPAVGTVGALGWATYWDVKWGGSFDDLGIAFIACVVAWLLILRGRFA
jgi:hypothetical protein